MCGKKKEQIKRLLARSWGIYAGSQLQIFRTFTTHTQRRKFNALVQSRLRSILSSFLLFFFFLILFHFVSHWGDDGKDGRARNVSAAGWRSSSNANITEFDRSCSSFPQHTHTHKKKRERNKRKIIIWLIKITKRKRKIIKKTKKNCGYFRGPLIRKMIRQRRSFHSRIYRCRLCACAFREC